MGDTPPPPVTTIPPFGDIEVLPECATFCGPLFDANGGCVPPAVPTGEPAAYTACFCSNAVLAPFSTGFAGVCDGACPAGGPGLSSIAAWYQDICSAGSGGNDDSNNGGDNGGGDNGGNNGGTSTTSTIGGGSSGDSSGADSGGGGDWISNHWQWVIALVILIVGISGIWIGACIWRRRYLKKKDRQSFISQKHSGSARHPSWGPAPSGIGTTSPDVYEFDERPGQGGFVAGTSAFPEEKNRSRKKKWFVNERT
jgi:hypothetical protein